MVGLLNYFLFRETRFMPRPYAKRKYQTQKKRDLSSPREVALVRFSAIVILRERSRLGNTKGLGLTCMLERGKSTRRIWSRRREEASRWSFFCSTRIIPETWQGYSGRNWAKNFLSNRKSKLKKLTLKISRLSNSIFKAICRGRIS